MKLKNTVVVFGAAVVLPAVRARVNPKVGNYQAINRIAREKSEFGVASMGLDVSHQAGNRQPLIAPRREFPP